MLTIEKYCQIVLGECRVNGEVIFCSGTETVREFLGDLYRAAKVNYPKFFKMDVLAKAGFLASELLLRGENLGDGKRTAIFLANSSASLDTDKRYQQTIGEPYFPSPSVFVYTLPNIVLGEICIRHGIYGENTFFVNPEFPVGFLCRYTGIVFEAAGLDRALVGWLECCDNKCEAKIVLVGRENEGLVFNEENINALK